MQVITIPLAASWSIFKFANAVWQIYLALSITGLCGGLVEAPVLAYVSEITTPRLRGMLSATSTLSVTLGVLLQFLVGTLLPWRTVALVCLGPPILSFCLLSLMPESPHWFIMHNKLNHARKSLAWLRGWGKVEDVEEEFEAMCRGHKLIVYNNPLKNRVDNPAFDGSFSNVNDNQKPISTETKSFIKEKIEHFKLFTRKSFLWPFAMVSFIYFLTNFTGAWTLQTCAINVFATLKAPMNKYYATILLGLVEFLGCTLSIFFFALCDIVVGVYAHINAIHYIEFKPDNLPSIPTIDEHNWILLVFLILIAFTGHCGLRVLPWILIGEIYSHETRATGCGAASAMSYVFGFFANKIFLTMINSLTIAWTYWCYGIIAFFGCLIMYFILPETEGKPLQEITDHFSGVSKLDNKVRRKNTNKNDVVV
ncbi:hypothetical protein RN001_008991 [Aquatica leii]|uniref:Major facilitator superfamily (MFS) profile domain-containing protein n=1 Tax=Aquatica leii TaxID=1421715 RepID=A0AAN7SRK6_9COLE|nr:hypothetical protein RN001_008991 [Aquatica leii]